MVEQKALAFRHEFYKHPERHRQESQIRDDIVSYLGEYRFEVTEFSYKLGITAGRLTDPNSGELMADKAKNSIEDRRKKWLKTGREEAELKGIVSLEQKLREKPLGTALWFSPPGPKTEGYGDYGFAYVGKKNGNSLDMTAIRLENPTMDDFNEASRALWGMVSEKAEDFLSSPQVLDIPEAEVKSYIHGTFNIKKDESRDIFQKAMRRMSDKIEDFVGIIRYGSEDQKNMAFRVLENLAEEFKDRYNRTELGNVVFFADELKLSEAMAMPRYQISPKPIAGSCGVSGRAESNDVFKSIGGSLANELYNKNNQEHFTCPKCKQTADGPVGNKCPSCGLTKEEYVKEGGKAC